MTYATHIDAAAGAEFRRVVMACRRARKVRWKRLSRLCDYVQIAYHGPRWRAHNGGSK